MVNGEKIEGPSFTERSVKEEQNYHTHPAVSSLMIRPAS